MASIAMMIGGAVVNALAFTGSNFLFSSISKNQVDEERKRHDLALEKLSAAKSRFERERVKYLDYLNDRMNRQNISKQTFSNIDRALMTYNEVTNENMQLPVGLRQEPKLSDFYTPSDDQATREIIFILTGMTVVGYLVYKWL